MIVVDTNVIAYFWLPGHFTASAEALVARDPEWAAPLLWRSEFRSVLAGSLRRGDLDLDTANRLAERAEAHLRGREFAVGSVEVLSRVAGSRCSAYDCEFVVLAEELGVPLVTTDRRILADFPETAVALRDAAGS
ncbi:MAG: type II toxin-antitoxin system VapC family toxin [Myxococcota bacterium]